MAIVILAVLGLCLGSFINAFVYRLHERTADLKKNKDLSIIHGRSICPSCKHQLGARDLVPIFSWIALQGKCRYCKQPISAQYPLVELITAVLFVVSYVYWPLVFGGQGTVLFVFWLLLLIGFVALAVYDLRWFLLPNRIIYPIYFLATLQILAVVIFFGGGGEFILESLIGLSVGGGIFYVLFQVSRGKWIGGGDVKLGGILGMVLGKADLALLMLFIASLIGSVIAAPLLITGKAKRGSKLPFGPLLIAATIIVRLFGASMISWYKRKFLLY